jgi:hypothetical protein
VATTIAPSRRYVASKALLAVLESERLHLLANAMRQQRFAEPPHCSTAGRARGLPRSRASSGALVRENQLDGGARYSVPWAPWRRPPTNCWRCAIGRTCAGFAYLQAERLMRGPCCNACDSMARIRIGPCLAGWAEAELATTAPR